MRLRAIDGLGKLNKDKAAFSKFFTCNPSRAGACKEVQDNVIII